jgi:hypothetical protein
MKVKIREGDTVKLIDTKAFYGYACYRRVLKIKNKPMVVRKVKQTGGILLEGFVVGFNMFGKEQGLTPDRFKLTKRA